MTGTLILVGSAFVASAVEMVEALTIVLAVGLTYNWRTALKEEICLSNYPKRPR